MCGIAGISWRTNSNALGSTLQSMIERLGHRGPDDRGSLVSRSGGSGLAHTRLSIIDLSDKGRQPLLNEDETLALVCNGEIYNHRELRRELENKGHRFHSDSDSEVILHLYEEVGPDAVHRLSGMFAFAIVDLTTDELFCARDPLGKKPLYFAETGMGVAFASEIPAFRSVPDLDWSLDPHSVALFLLRNFRHVPAPGTAFKSIRALSPGHWLQIRHGEILQQVRYWIPSFEIHAVSENDLLKAFDRAVEKRSAADVEIAALLSGGTDSTAIVDSYKRQTGRDIRTFAFGVDDNDEELVRARYASKLLGSDHREVHYDPERQHEMFDDLLVRHGQPVAALPLTHAMMLFEAIKDEGIKVVMAGHGADEVFYGYDGAQALCRLSQFERLLPTGLTRWGAKLLAPLVGHGSLGEALSVLASSPGKRKASLYERDALRLWPELMEAPLAAKDAGRWVAPWFEGGAPEHYIDEAAFLGLIEENAHAVTVAGDLPAMAHGIEVRCPFLDKELVEMGIAIPYRDKVGKSCQGGGKQILKHALRGRLPADILYAPKRGFGYFVQEEQVLRGPWKKWVDEAFNDPDDLDGFLDISAVKEIKRRFDERDPTVPAILVAKLYALQRFARLGRVC